MMDFIKEIHEARMIKNSRDQKSLTYTDCCEKLFLILCILEVMRYDKNNESFIKNYAYNTKSNNYADFKISSTDLYNFMHFALGKDDVLDKLKDPGSAKKVRRTTFLPKDEINLYLAKIENNPRSGSIKPYQLFFSIYKSLGSIIGEYNGLRQRLGNYTKIPKTERKELITKLLFAARAKLRSSDIIDDFSRWVGKNNLEVDYIDDTEIEISKPDFDSASSKDMAYYRMLVGNEKMVLAHKFVERAFRKQTAPINYIESYLPIITMIHDFIKAGPTAIHQLKLLHKRIKK